MLLDAAEHLVGEWDPDRLARVIANLLANAIRYSPSGSDIVVTIGEQVHEHRAWAILQVCDQGIGIPAAELPFVFERFYRSKEHRTCTSCGHLNPAPAKYAD